MIFTTAAGKQEPLAGQAFQSKLILVVGCVGGHDRHLFIFAHRFAVHQGNWQGGKTAMTHLLPYPFRYFMVSTFEERDIDSRIKLSELPEQRRDDRAGQTRYN